MFSARDALLLASKNASPEVYAVYGKCITAIKKAAIAGRYYTYVEAGGMEAFIISKLASLGYECRVVRVRGLGRRGGYYNTLQIRWDSVPQENTLPGGIAIKEF